MAKKPQPIEQRAQAFDPYAPEPVTWRGSATSEFEVQEDTGGFLQRMRDAGRMTWIKQLEESAKVEYNEGWKQAVAGFDALEHLPKGYEPYAGAFANATSPEEVEAIRQRVDRNIAARRRRMQATFGQTLTVDLIAGVMDPTNLIPVAGTVGQGAVKGALKGSVSMGAIGGATSAAAAALDPTATWDEAAIGAGTSAVLGGAIGGGAGVLGRPKGAPGVRTKLALPGGPARILSKFGLRKAPKQGASTNHRGVDLEYPENTPLRAQAPAKVLKVTKTAKGGNEVHLDYGNGLTVKMLHLKSIDVREGMTVAEGTVLGRSGRTGNVTGPHLHLATYVNGKAVDPMGSFDLGLRPADHGASIDVLSGVAIPETLALRRREVPVVVERGTGVDVQLHNDRLDRLVDDALDEIAVDRTPADRLHNGVRGDAEDAIAEYLKGGGVVTRVKRGRRAIDPRKWQDVEEIEIAGTGRDPSVVDPKLIAMTANRVAARLAEILNHPRARLDEPADEDWLKRLAPELAKVPLAARNAAWRRAAPKMRDVVEVLSDRLEELRENVTGKTPLAVEAEAHARARYTEKLDDADLEIAAQRRGETRVLRDDGELRPFRADRPLTAAERRRGRVLPELPAEAEATDADTVLSRLAIDPDAIRENFLNQRWTEEPLPGGRTIDANAFGDHADYFNFVVNRAVAIEEMVEDGINPGELIAKANERALKEIEEGNGLFVPDGGRLKRAVLAYTPMEQMHRLVPDDALIQRAMYQLAGDGGVMLTANRLGLPAAEGGSVLQRRDRWVGKLYDVTSAVDRAWLKSIGRDSTRGRGATILTKTMNRLTHWGDSGLDHFWTEVGRAAVGFDDVGAEAAEAAGTWFKVMGDVEAEARSLGLFTTLADGAKAVNQAELRVANLARKVGELESKGFDERAIQPLRKLLAEQEDALTRLREIADQPLTHKDEPGHFSRIWNKRALLEDREGALLMLEQAYKREQHPDPRAAAQGAYELLLADNEGELIAPGTPGFLKLRAIPATNKEAWKYIVQDPRVVGAIYLRRMGAAIEMTRMFGDSFGLAEIDRLAADLVQRGVDAETVSKAVQLFEDQRDRIVGGFHGKDPLSWDNRTARAIRNATQLELMGGSPKSQLSDIARMVLTQGVGLRHQLLGKPDADAGLLGAIMAHVKGDLDRFAPGGPTKEAGEALDLVLAQAAAKLIESDDALVVTRQTGLERVLAAAVPRFHIATLLTPLTVVLKEWTGVAAASNLIRDVKKVAAGEASDRLLAQLAQKGISPEMAHIIASMPTETGTSGLHLANMAAWADKEGGAEAMEAFRSAVHAEVRRTVITPGPLDKPAIADGVTHDWKARAEAEAAIDEKTFEVLQIRGELAALADLPDGHPSKQGVIDRLSAAAGELTQMKRSRGRAGRKERPLLALPFQLRSYGLAAGPKGMHGLLTGSDRRRAIGVLSLLAAGYMSWSWKLGWNTAEQPLEAHVTGMIDNSGILGWTGDIAKSIDTLFSSMTGGIVPDSIEPKEGAWDELGAIAPSFGMFERLYRPFVEVGDDQAHAIRKAIPMQNAVYLKWLFDALEDAMDGDGSVDDGQQYQAPGEPGERRNGIDRGRLPPEQLAKIEAGVVLNPTSVDDLNVVLAMQKARGEPRNLTAHRPMLEDLDVLLTLYQDDHKEKLRRKAAKRDKPPKARARSRRLLVNATYR